MAAASEAPPDAIVSPPAPAYQAIMHEVLALRALAAILGDPALCGRFVALTGYDADTLRARAGEPDVARAVAAFVRGHEPDLVRVASLVGVTPEQLCARS